MNVKTYLITGVAGFIGSLIAQKLLKQGHKVVGVDNFLTGLKSNIPEEVEFFEIDITEENQLKVLNDFKFDAVLHLAAQTSGEISFDVPQKDLLINTLGTLNLLEYCVENKINRFLYASSMAVYGDVEKLPFKIDYHAHPKSYYGITKLAGEYYVDAYSDRINTTSFRMFNVYGPGQNMENMRQGMVSIFLSYLMQDKTITVKGSKDRFRDLIFIDDIITVWTKAIEKPKTFGKKYNLGSGKQTTVEELLKLMTKAWGNPNHRIEYIEGTPKDQFGARADIEPLKNDLDWKPEIFAEEGVKKFVNWAKKL